MQPLIPISENSSQKLNIFPPCTLVHWRKHHMSYILFCSCFCVFWDILRSFLDQYMELPLSCFYNCIFFHWWKSRISYLVWAAPDGDIVVSSVVCSQTVLQWVTCTQTTPHVCKQIHGPNSCRWGGWHLINVAKLPQRGENQQKIPPTMMGVACCPSALPTTFQTCDFLPITGDKGISLWFGFPFLLWDMKLNIFHRFFKSDLYFLFCELSVHILCPFQPRSVSKVQPHAIQSSSPLPLTQARLSGGWGMIWPQGWGGGRDWQAEVSFHGWLRAHDRRHPSGPAWLWHLSWWVCWRLSWACVHLHLFAFPSLSERPPHLPLDPEVHACSQPFLQLGHPIAGPSGSLSSPPTPTAC